MAELSVGTLNVTLTADGSAAIAEFDKVKQAAGSAAEGIAEGFDGAKDGLDGVKAGAAEASDAMDKAGNAGEQAGKKIGDGAKKATASLKEVGKMMSDVGKTATVALTTPIVGALTAAVSGASDLTETVSKTEVVFDRMSDKVMRWSEDSVRAMGLAQGSALDYAATYGDMATGMGLSIERSAEMSMNLTQLAADMASFKNIRTDVAAQKLNAVFTGETEGLKSMGIVMTQANLQAFAMSQGITEQVSKLSQAEQVMLRYQYVMSATKNAQGDFARTGDSLANQSRKLTETLKQTGESFGAILTPAVTGVVSTLQGIVQGIAELDEGTKRTIVSAAMAVAAVGPVLLVGGKIISMIVSLQGALAALSLNPVIVALAAVAALGVSFAGFSGMMKGASSEATRATESYQRMKETVEGGVSGTVTMDTEDWDKIEDKDVTVNITADGKEAIDKAEALVKDLQSDKYKGKLAIDGDPAKAEAALAKIEGDIIAAKAALSIDGDPEAARSAVEQLQSDIALLEGMVAITEDPATRAALNARINTLKGQIQEITGSVSFTVSGQDELEHYRETLEGLPKDQSFNGYGRFTFTDGAKENLQQFNEAMMAAAGTVGDFKSAVEDMNQAVDADLQNAIQQVLQQTNDQIDTLTAVYKNGGLSYEQYIAAIQQEIDAKDAEIKRLQKEAEGQKEVNKQLADGSATNDAETVGRLKSEQYDKTGGKQVTPELTNQSLSLIDQAGDRSSMQMEGATALLGLQQQAQAQYESLTAAVEAYSQAQADANAQQESADTASKLAEDYGAMGEAILQYGNLVYADVDRQEAFNMALQSMGENASPEAIQALTDALHGADGELVGYADSLDALASAEQLQDEAAQRSAEAQQAATDQKTQALEALKTALNEVAEGGLTPEDAGQALIQIDETGVDISGAQTALITGVPAAVQEAIAAADSASTEGGQELMDTLAAAVGASAGLVESATGTAVTTSITGAASTAQSSSRQIGTNLMSGAESGVKASAGRLARAAAQAVREAIQAAKSAAEIKSPSRVMEREVGAQMMRGGEVGIIKETPRAITTIKRSVGQLISGAASVAKGTTWAQPVPAMAAGPAIDYDAMGQAMSGAMSRVRFGFQVGEREMAEATRNEASGQMAIRANQVNRGYGGRV